MESTPATTAPASATIFTSPIKLSYFDCRGLAETSRYMLAIGGVPYTDHRFPFTFGVPGDFTTVSRPEFDAAQASGAFKCGMGKVPVLETEGVCISQSKAIERYVARLAGMDGDTPAESAQIDAVNEHVRDIKQAYQPCRKVEGDEAKKAAMDKWFAETLPALSVKLEDALPSCVAKENGEAPVGAGVNHAHVSIYRLYREFFDNQDGAAAALEDCPRIQAICAGVANHPAVITWQEQRPDTAF